FFFFFSSRRRHTRSYGDWSSDVCSSDLDEDAECFHLVSPLVNCGDGPEIVCQIRVGEVVKRDVEITLVAPGFPPTVARDHVRFRSEERRVGKECRDRVSTDGYRKTESAG